MRLSFVYNKNCQGGELGKALPNKGNYTGVIKD